VGFKDVIAKNAESPDYSFSFQQWDLKYGNGIFISERVTVSASSSGI